MANGTYIYELVVNCGSGRNEEYKIIIEFDPESMSLNGVYINCREGAAGHKLIAGPEGISEVEIERRVEEFANYLSREAINEIQEDFQIECNNPEIVLLRRIRER